MKIKLLTVGGTIDKVYFDKKSTYQVGRPTAGDILGEANVGFEYQCEEVLAKDSLDMTDDDRRLVLKRVQADANRHIIITHGTDTMVETARYIEGKVGDKTVVLTGALQPARFKTSDAVFNIGCAVAAVQALPPGVYIVMNGRIWKPGNVRKNVERERFEEIT